MLFQHDVDIEFPMKFKMYLFLNFYILKKNNCPQGKWLEE